jgi:sodium-dependent phosphate transporter
MDRAESGTIDPKLVITEEPQTARSKVAGFFTKAGKVATHGMTVDIHKAVEKNEKVHEIHANAEVFEPRVELAFSYLQVFSACCVIFAHGAGEVGYMAGPLTTIWDIYQYGYVSKNIKPPVWVLLIGAFGLVFGLATYGYNVTRAMGVKLAKITPTRGFAAELATAAIIMIASQYGLPTSSSQCITGGIVGVGLMDGVKGVNWMIFARQFASWVATLFCVGLFTAAIFAQGVYSPSKIEGAQIVTYENRVANITMQIYKDMNSTLYAYRGAANDSALARLPPTDWATLNRTLAVANAAAKGQVDTKKQSVTPEAVMGSLNKALALLQQYTVNTLGQNTVYVGSNACNGNTTASIQANEAAVCVAPKLIPSAYATKFP